MDRSAYAFAFPFRVRYSEIDGQRIVFNAHYLTYFDVAIHEYFRWLGYDYDANPETDFHTVKALVNFHAPIRFDEDIDVHVRVARIGGSSMTLACAIYGRDGDADLRASGEIVWVHAVRGAHRSIRIPDDLRDLVARKETTPPEGAASGRT